MPDLVVSLLPLRAHLVSNRALEVVVSDRLAYFGKPRAEVFMADRRPEGIVCPTALYRGGQLGHKLAAEVIEV